MTLTHFDHTNNTLDTQSTKCLMKFNKFFFANNNDECIMSCAFI